MGTSSNPLIVQTSKLMQNLLSCNTLLFYFAFHCDFLLHKIVHEGSGGVLESFFLISNKNVYCIKLGGSQSTQKGVLESLVTLQ